MTVWIERPSISLRPRAGQFFAIALHEFAASAMQHGLLGAGKGRLLIHWSIVAADGEHLVRFVWQEEGAARHAL